jgi:hypothetical protein
MKISTALKSLLGIGALTLPLVASAASTYTTGTGGLTAAATVNFSVAIPKVLYLRVGTGSSYTTGVLATNATPDLITFSPALGSTGTPVAGVGGDQTNGVETAAVVSNGGNVSLVATTTATGLSDGNGDFIPFTQISTAAAGNSGGYTLLQPPLLNATGTSTTVNLTASAAKVINADAKWTYTYNNSVTYPGGTYGGTTALGGTVTYTATMP